MRRERMGWEEVKNKGCLWCSGSTPGTASDICQDDASLSGCYSEGKPAKVCTIR